VTHPQQGGGYGSPQQGGYGPLPGYPPQQPWGYGPHPPKKPKTGLIVGIVAGVVVVALGLVVVLALRSEGDDKPGTAGGGGAPPGAPAIPDPTLDYTADNAPPGGGADSGPSGGGGGGGAANPGELALTVAQIIQDHDTAAIEEYACNAGEVHYLQQDLAQLDGKDVIARPQAIEQTSETMAETTIKLTFDGQTVDFPLRMQQRDDSWCAISAT
jgi:hypothetical protein